MIKWLTDNIGTGAYDKVAPILEPDIAILDVRDLVDKPGNELEVIEQKITQALEYLRHSKKLVICCDYGMSRSNSIAVGVIALYHGLSSYEAILKLKDKVDEADLKLSVLSPVLDVIEKSKGIQKPSFNKEKRRILVTGANGFIGKNLTPLLRSQGHTIFAPSSKEIDIEKHTISLHLLIREQQIDTIIHLANPRIYTTVESFGKSLVMLRNILDVCIQNGIRLIYTSDWEIYSGYKTSQIFADENLPAFPKGVYAESKWISEKLIEQFSKNYGLNYLILRSSLIYGLGSDKPKFIYSFIEKALKNEPIVTHEYLNGKPMLDLIFISDFVNALQNSVYIPDDFNQSLNIGTGKLVSTFEVANIIVKTLNSRSKISIHKINDYHANVAMITQKANKYLNWKPLHKFEEAINEIIQKKQNEYS